MWSVLVYCVPDLANTDLSLWYPKCVTSQKSQHRCGLICQLFAFIFLFMDPTVRWHHVGFWRLSFQLPHRTDGEWLTQGTELPGISRRFILSLISLSALLQWAESKTVTSNATKFSLFSTFTLVYSFFKDPSYLQPTIALKVLYASRSSHIRCIHCSYETTNLWRIWLQRPDL